MIRAFVSSTYRDLKDHRAYVIERLARGGIFVDPMEKWTAASDEPKGLSQDRMKDAQLCILLVGFRRGHIPEGETRSITQLEYREALRLGIHVLVFMANERADWPAEAVAALDADPEIVRWRAELTEHTVVGFFTPRPESIDVDAAVNRWLQEQVTSRGKAELDAPDEDAASIDVRAYSNSEGVLILWRAPQAIEGCIGFALYRRVLGDAGVTEEVVGSRLGFSSSGIPAEPLPSSEQPIQHFRWMDREPREVRYRVVPVTGTPGQLQLAESSGSTWTRWVSPRVGQTPEWRAFFNAATSSAWVTRASLKERNADQEAALHESRHADLRRYLGGGLRQMLLEMIGAAKLLDQRIYAALSAVDDPELIAALKLLGKNLHLKVPSAPGRRNSKGAFDDRASKKLCRELSAASFQVYEAPRQAGSARSNFAVVCDRWGTPLRVWTGSAAWTSRALCLHPNNGILIESVPVARAYLDRWDDLPDGCHRKPLKRVRSTHTHIRERGMSVTVWNTPTSANADLRDASRLIRGARQGVLFIVNASRVAQIVMNDIVRLVDDKDLFIEGVSWSCGLGRRRHVTYEYRRNEKRSLFSIPALSMPIDSTIVLVDAFGPHPVVITGSHDLGAETSTKSISDLLIIENAPGLAAEYAVHVIGLLDWYRWRFATNIRRGGSFIGLSPTPAWQQRFFGGTARSELNFLFGSLSPGL